MDPLTYRIFKHPFEFFSHCRTKLLLVISAVVIVCVKTNENFELIGKIAIDERKISVLLSLTCATNAFQNI